MEGERVAKRQTATRRRRRRLRVALLYLIFIWMPHSNVKAYRRLVCWPIHSKCHVIAFNDKNAQAKKLSAFSENSERVKKKIPFQLERWMDCVNGRMRASAYTYPSKIAHGNLIWRHKFALN